MLNKYAYIPLFCTLAFMVACAPTSQNHQGDDDDNPGEIDGSVDDPDSSFVFIDADTTDAPPEPMIDAGNIYPDANNGGQDGGCAATECPNPNGNGCGPTEICGNGSDDNCNGKVDENCACQAGSVQACFANAPGYRGKGACMDGQQTCQGTGEFPTWGPCTGGITPHPESCDSLDNDCNGCIDDNPECCQVDLQCPASMPDGVPFQNYPIDGTMFYAGMVSLWTWTVTGGPCDKLLAPNVSYKLNNMPNVTTVSGANLSTLNFFPTLSGDYTVHVVMTLPNGMTYECTFIVHIKGPGLRVELCWETDGTDDIDLHVHKPGTTTPWFDTGIFTTNNDDCHYSNCKANGNINWGTAYPNSPVTECNGGPEGPAWNNLGFCRNPRLDIDNISTVGKPENVNVDKPENNKTYRVAVHHYNRSAGMPAAQARPLVNIYCGGVLKATYGQAPDFAPGFSETPNAGGRGMGPIWRVVDVKPVVNGAGDTTDCTLAPLHPSGSTTGYNVSCPNDAACVDNTY